LEDLSVNGKILKCIFEKQNGRVWNGFIWPRRRTGAGNFLTSSVSGFQEGICSMQLVKTFTYQATLSWHFNILQHCLLVYTSFVLYTQYWFVYVVVLSWHTHFIFCWNCFRNWKTKHEIKIIPFNRQHTYHKLINKKHATRN
jgi:hypothetical protein